MCDEESDEHSMIKSDELKKIISSDGLVSHIRADQAVKNAFMAFDQHRNQPFDVIASIFASLISYVDSTNKSDAEK